MPKTIKQKSAKPKAKSAPVRKKAAATPQHASRPLATNSASGVIDRLFNVVLERRNADPAVSHSARLMSRGIAKVAQKFGEEAVECLIEGVRGDREALVAESADVLYHLIVLWVASGVHAEQVWAELRRREGVSGIAEKASRPRNLPALGAETSKIP